VANLTTVAWTCSSPPPDQLSLLSASVAILPFSRFSATYLLRRCIRDYLQYILPPDTRPSSAIHTFKLRFHVLNSSESWTGTSKSWFDLNPDWNHPWRFDRTTRRLDLEWNVLLECILKWPILTYTEVKNATINGAKHGSLIGAS